MEIINSKEKEKPLIHELSEEQVSRRKFLRLSGLFGVSAAVLATGCSRDDRGTQNNNRGVDLGSGDTGILNYAFALEQLEAAFYIQVMQTPFSGMTTEQSTFLQEIRDHEIAHREFFRRVLGSNAIPNLEVDFSAINFSNRDSVLQTARTFEDLGVAAYNGAGRLLTNANNLLFAGKIVSVEARHAALIRELIAPNSFAANDVIDANGLDRALTPIQVLTAADPFIKTQINASNLPS